MSRTRATMVSQVLPLFSIVIELLLVPVLCCCSVNSCPLLMRCSPFPFPFPFPFPLIVNHIFSRIMRMYCFSGHVRTNIMEEDEYFFVLMNKLFLSRTLMLMLTIVKTKRKQILPVGNFFERTKSMIKVQIILNCEAVRVFQSIRDLFTWKNRGMEISN